MTDVISNQSNVDTQQQQQEQVDNKQTKLDNNEPQPESIKKLMEYMERDVIVGVVGNRVIKGKLTCLDKQENILLSNAHEELFTDEKYQQYLEKKKAVDETLPESERTEPIKPKNNGRKELGFIIVPMKYIVSCRVSKKPAEKQAVVINSNNSNNNNNNNNNSNNNNNDNKNKQTITTTSTVTDTATTTTTQ
ncbi:hypothetical protein PPL_00119 [Heterostelium album PN500]|uniref:Sm domain-containing protein n=1 Tax=Heterostelium pallidum (strain ATCC 26659 / Pp 5 / PN500) TaxID=670386 RepID=D3AVK5_HETP5|nr:hypothetical protein PPL_00119 [Heterostelium album PN500]EFA86328.1 hypothetical protein PPL_00119 [Heterostelium album PN500]|eukprot:XP_020438433.1 hypothetical protein PPL_00119 [Heterostelium album PN500]